MKNTKLWTILFILMVPMVLTSCQEEMNDIEKGEACIEEQKKKFGKDYSPADAGPCIRKYWYPNGEDTNPYLKEEK